MTGVPPDVLVMLNYKPTFIVLQFEQDSPTHFHLSISVGLCPHFFAGQNSSPELSASPPSQRIVPNKAEAVRIVTNRTFFISFVCSTEESRKAAPILKKIKKEGVKLPKPFFNPMQIKFNKHLLNYSVSGEGKKILPFLTIKWCKKKKL